MNTIKASATIIHDLSEMVGFFEEKQFTSMHVITDYSQQEIQHITRVLKEKIMIDVKTTKNLGHEVLQVILPLDKQTTDEEQKEAFVFITGVRDSTTLLSKVITEYLKQQETLAEKKSNDLLRELLMRKTKNVFYLIDAFVEASFHHYEVKKTLRNLKTMIISNNIMDLEELTQIMFLLEMDPEYQKQMLILEDCDISIFGSPELEMLRRKAYMLSLRFI